MSVVVADVGDIGGWRGLGGAEGPLLRMDDALEFTLLGAPLFFVPKDRKKDHWSDSNWTDSNSEASGEWSSNAASMSSSILRSAKRMMKT